MPFLSRLNALLSALITPKERNAQHSFIIKGLGIALFAHFVFAVLSANMKFLGDDLAYDTPTIGFMVGVVGALCCLLWLGGQRRIRDLRLKNPRSVAVLVPIELGALFFSISALANLPLAVAIILFFISPILASILAIFILGERYKWPTYFALFIGLVATLLIAQPDPDSGITEIGLLYGFLASSCFAIEHVVVRAIGLKGNENPAAMAFYYYLAAAAILLGFAWPHIMPVLQSGDLWAFVSLGFMDALAVVLLYASYKYLSTTIGSSLKYTQLIWAVLIGWLVWGEMPDLITWIGACALILSGIYIVQQKQIPRRIRP